MKRINVFLSFYMKNIKIKVIELYIVKQDMYVMFNENILILNLKVIWILYRGDINPFEYIEKNFFINRKEMIDTKTE